MSEIITTLSIIGGFLLILFAGGLIADYIFPHLDFLDRFYFTLPMSDPEKYDLDPFEPIDADYKPVN